MDENIRNSMYTLDSIDLVTINLDAAYHYVRNMCKRSNVVFSTCFELS